MYSKSKLSILFIARAAVIAALYVGLTFAFAFMSFNGIQFRISEALTILPLIFPESIVGLTIGCALANIINSPIDVGLGSAATLTATLLTFAVGYYVKNTKLKLSLGVIPPILVNALVVPVIILLVAPEFSLGYFVDFGFVMLGQTTVIVLLGIPLYLGLKRLIKRSPRLLGNNLLTRTALGSQEQEPNTVSEN